VSTRKFTVALIGPDGAGKTTVSRRLAAESTVPLTSIYMGVNSDSSGLMLPTTRLLLALKRARGGRPDMVAATERNRRQPRPRDPLRRSAAACKSAARLAVWLSEEWFRQLVAWWYSTVRGRVVLFDRHFFADYYDYDVAARHGARPLSGRVHGFLLRHLYPKPDLVICLDAPADVLFARKGEASVEWLANRRKEYLRMREVVPHFAAVDASASLEQVTADVAEAISSFERRRARPG
jgi:thymidylate kinase